MRPVQASTAVEAPVRVAELMACLSIATDLGMGQPVDYALTSCIVGVRLGDALGFDTETLQDVYYEALLRYVGCNAETDWMASLLGDELAFRAEFAKIDSANPAEVLSLVVRFIRRANADKSALRVAQLVVSGLADMSQVNASFLPGHCEVAKRLAERMGFPARFLGVVSQIYARWDGKGVPALKGEAIAPALLCASLAQDAVTFHRLGGVASATAMARARRGRAHAPHMVDLFCAQAPRLFAGIDATPLWDQVLALEPGTGRSLDPEALDGALEAVADFSDIKSPWFLNHSRAVADLAARAATHFRLPAADCRTLRRAGLVHDIGKVGVTASLWGHTGALSDRQWEAVRQHPYYTGRVFARSVALTPLGALASLHHERLDGSGYHRNLPGAMLPASARILAAANRYQALTEARAHRAALSADHAAERLRSDAARNQFDPDAVRAVLDAAGHRPRRTDATVPDGLTQREIEVLRLLARGRTMKAAAAELQVSYKTIDRHVQNIYGKIGVTTRAGAILWAMEHGMV
jgi:response regulator RpfG family c-di-GMP phosphodiesterase/DNA-binding CsgD family transcriptional regulator